MRINYTKYAEHFLKLELMKANIEVFQNESGDDALSFIAKTTEGVYHELHLKALVIDRGHHIKIAKAALPQPKENLWIAIVMITKKMDCSMYLIPSMTLNKPSKYTFVGKQNNKALYWEINVILEAIPELSQFTLNRMGGLNSSV